MRERSLRACRACRKRKVRCDGNGELSCTQCTRLALNCCYPDVDPTSRLRRFTVRGSARQSYSNAEASPVDHALKDPTQASSVDMPAAAAQCGLAFDTKFFRSLISDYSNAVLPTFPVISTSGFDAAIRGMSDSLDDFTLVHSIAAATWAIVCMTSTASTSYPDQVRFLYNKALDSRGHVLPPTHITVNNIMTSVFLAKCVGDVDRDSRACYYYLRDAITRLQLLRVNDPASQTQQTQTEKNVRERAYWLLFIQERFDALCNFRPAALVPIPQLPEFDESMPIEVHVGFLRLIELFRMVDAEFIKFRLDGSSSAITVDWIRQKQAELGDNVESWEESIGILSHLQQVDLCVTRYWLRAIVWQMSLQLFSLLPEGRVEEDYMSVLFPIRLSYKLRSLLLNIPRQAVEVHSTGILHKIFEIAAISADILEHVVAWTEHRGQQTDHIDNFVFLSGFLLSMPRFNERTILESRFRTVQTLFPWYFNGTGTDAWKE